MPREPRKSRRDWHCNRVWRIRHARLSPKQWREDETIGSYQSHRLRLLAKQNGKWPCAANVPIADHIDPLAKEGWHIQPENLPACAAMQPAKGYDQG